MSCNFADCKIQDKNECLISCWICEESFHGACAGLGGQVVDAWHASLGLKWSCASCQSVDFEVVKSVRASRKNFLEIRSDLNDIISKFKLLEDSFGFFKINNSVNSSKKISKSSKKLTFPKSLKALKAKKSTKLSIPQTSSAVVSPAVEAILATNTPNSSNAIIINDSSAVVPLAKTKNTISNYPFGDVSDSDVPTITYAQVAEVHSD